MAQEVYRNGDKLSDYRVADAVAEVAQLVFAWDGMIAAGELPVAPTLVAVVEIATEVGGIGALVYFGGHFEHDEAGRVVAAPTCHYQIFIRVEIA
jgi:hypothetical protein